MRLRLHHHNLTALPFEEKQAVPYFANQFKLLVDQILYLKRCPEFRGVNNLADRLLHHHPPKKRRRLNEEGQDLATGEESHEEEEEEVIAQI